MLDQVSVGAGRPGGALRRAGTLLRSPSAGLLGIGLVWFVAAFAVLLWTWGLDPLVFPSSDEAVVRFAASLIGKHQAPFLDLPLPDPEDLLHPRSWITIGNRATPTYAPVSFYVYGWLLRLQNVGLVLISVMPAAAVGAFAAGTARLMPTSRRWLALAAPAAAFPALYWVLHTWVNGSPLLIGICWAVFYWAGWRETERIGWLAAALLCLGYSSAVRPDYAAYLLLVALLLSVAASPREWKVIAGIVVLSGVLALSANLILNKLITGHAGRAAYQMAIDRQWGPADPKELPGLGLLRSLLIPMGIPSWEVGSAAFRKYWLTLGPAPLLLLGQLALVPLLLQGSRLQRGLRTGAVLVVLFFAVSRLQDQVFGAQFPDGQVHHSVPRYLSPVYLMAALPPLLFLGQCRRFVVFLPGAVLLGVLALGGIYEIAIHGVSSQTWLREFVQKRETALTQLSRSIPATATVYTTSEDKWIWSRWRTWMIEDTEPSAKSIDRAVEAKLELYLLEPSYNAKVKRLAAALRRRHVSLVRVDARRGVYRIVRETAPEPGPAPAPTPDAQDAEQRREE